VSDWHRVLGKIEIEEIRKLVAEGVAEKPIGLADVLENLVVDRDVVAEILRCDPEADDIGAMLGDVGVAGLRLLVGAALRDLLAGLVDDEAVGEDGLVGRAAEGDHARPKGRLEPPAVLVAALEVEVGGPLRVALMRAEHGGVGTSLSRSRRRGCRGRRSGRWRRANRRAA